MSKEEAKVTTKCEYGVEQGFQSPKGVFKIAWMLPYQVAGFLSLMQRDNIHDLIIDQVAGNFEHSDRVRIH